MKKYTLTACAVVGLLFLAGCAKSPSMTGAAMPIDGVRAGLTTDGRPSPRDFTVHSDVNGIRFDFDKYAIRPDAAKILEADAQWLNRNRNHLVLIEGHCDERGTSDYNLALGEQRAKATMNYLVAHGVAAARITVITYGSERPVCTEKNEACWAKNRRAHLLVKAQ
ncbi:MAG: peptidoglycan-associated lipoprotein Pal [Candidatus Rokubacteria bacterium]|nr:peptidoglycan-associated lipoprotein Pal [Candidatus Rokubacteria bacterium]